MTKRVLILGIGGQDGSLMADLLLENGYQVHGLHRRSSVDNLARIAHIRHRLTLHEGDLTDAGSLYRVVRASDPAEVYHLADQDHVGHSFHCPLVSAQVTYGGTANVLEACRMCLDGICDGIRVLVPISATVFGDAPPPQNEQTPFNPLSPYAVAKAGCFHLARYYRQCYGMHVSTAILGNHDSPRRQGDYLLHKIARGAVRIARGEQDYLALADLHTVVDIGYAPEYVEGMWRTLQRPVPGDYVLATGRGYTVSRWVALAFRAAGVDDPNQTRVKVDPAFARPGPQAQLVGDSKKAREALGWETMTPPGVLMAALVEKYQKEFP